MLTAIIIALTFLTVNDAFHYPDVLVTTGTSSTDHGFHVQETRRTATIIGNVIDIQSGNPVSFAYLHLEEIQRSTTSDVTGNFQFQNVPEGDYTLHIQRIGYVTRTHLITVVDDPTVELQIPLMPVVVTGESIQVSADNDNLSGSNIEHASLRLAGSELRQSLNTTLSETLQNQPGFAQRSMGSAAGRPVIRGLGDERVLILQDGENSGDVSWSSSDHAVTIDPSGANEIEIARGPAALEYGANAIGGIINVVSHKIPNTVPTKTGGSWSTQVNSNNLGLMSAGSLSIPVNDIAINASLSGRTGSDFRSPAGVITNTDSQTLNGSVGTGLIRPWGYAGIAGTTYFNTYGIPPDPEGGHSAGVDIEMKKFQLEGRGELLPQNNNLFSLLEVRGNITHYNHTETEPGGILGTEYTLLRSSFSVKGRFNNWGFFERGVIGISAESMDYAVFGSRTPDATSWNASVFTIQESDFNNLHVETGLRLDMNTTTPDNDRPESSIGNVRQRTFKAISSSVSLNLSVGERVNIGSTFLHSYRPPSFEEIFSEGPHLASYSYEIGNPDLDAERGIATELFASYSKDENSFGVSLFYNHFNNFIHAQNTGMRNTQFPDLNNYQFIGTEATLYGIELQTALRIHNNWNISGTLSSTTGDRTLTETERDLTGLERKRQPLPMIPPLSGSVGLEYSIGKFAVNARTRYATKQNRLGEFESETPGYIVVDLGTQLMIDWGATLHTFSLNIQNLLNEDYYNHLSRIKEIFPEPGRSANLLYRIYF